MMQRILNAVFFLLLLVITPLSLAAAQNVAQNFSLRDNRGKLRALDDYRDQNAIVIVVQGNGCPIVRKSISYLNELQKQFAGQGIVFLMLNSNPQDDDASIVQEAKDFGIDWPILEDRSQVAALALKVSRTAEAFIIDPKTLAVVYRGPIHDKLGYETERPTVEREYLKDHLKAFLQGVVLESPVPQVKGCLVTAL